MAKKDFKKSAAEIFITSTDDQEAAADPAQIRTEDNVIIPKGYKLVKENKSERLQILIRPTIKKALRDIAKAQGAKSLNDLINNIFEEYIERQGE